MKLYKHITGADPGFQVRGGVLKKFAPSGGRRGNLWGISCEKSRFYAKKSYFFPILGGEGGGGRGRAPPPPGSAPVLNVKIFLCVNRNIAWIRHHDFSITTPLYAKE